MTRSLRLMTVAEVARPVPPFVPLWRGEEEGLAKVIWMKGE